MITPVELTISTNSAWTDLDVSAQVPAAATGVILHVVFTNDFNFGVRKKGSTDAVYEAVAYNTHLWAVSGLDASRVFQYYTTDKNNTKVYLVGYFEAEAVFFDSMPTKTPTASTWESVDISLNTGADTAVAAIWYFLGGGGSPENSGAQRNGSSHDVYNNAPYACLFCGLDGSEICELYRSAGTFYLAGYIKSSADLSIDFTPVNPASGDWYDLTLGSLPAGTVAAVFHISGNGTYGLRADGSAEDIYKSLSYSNPFAIVALGSGVIEGKISGSSEAIDLIGTLQSGVVDVTIDCSTFPILLTSDLLCASAELDNNIIDFSAAPITLTLTPVITGFISDIIIDFSATPIELTFTPSFDEVTFADINGNLVATLPAIYANASGRGSGQINVSLPAVTTSGFIHGTSKTTGNIAVTLPAVAAEIVSGLVIEAELPAITASMTGLMGTVGAINASLPALTVEIVTAWGLNLTLPAISASMTGLMGSVGALNAPLPGITFDATLIQGIIGRINASLPALRRVTMGGLHELLLDMDVALPALQVEIRGTTGIVASFSQPLFIWPLQMEITGRVEHIGRINATLPAIQAELTWFDALYGAVRTFGLVENTLNFGLTTYSGYLLNSMTKVNGRQIGCNINGLFELIGNRDAGTRRIDAEIDLPPLDYGDGMITRVRDVWLTKRCDGALLITIVPDEGDVFDYQTLLVNDEVHQERVKLGRGLKARYNGFTIKNLNGADFEIDGVSFLGEPVEHRKR